MLRGCISDEKLLGGLNALLQKSSLVPGLTCPPKSKIKQLDAFRRGLEVADDEVFMVMIGSTTWAVIKTQELTRNQLRHDFPDYSENQIWRAVIVCRLGAKLNLELTNLSLGVGVDGSEVVKEKMESMDEIMMSINSWADVVNYVLEMEKDWFGRDPMGAKVELDRILMA